MKNTLLLFTLVIVTTLVTQGQSSIQVIDSTSKTPLRDVYLVKETQQKIFILSVSDEKGIIKVPLDSNKNDSLYLSHISYKKKYINIQPLKNNVIELNAINNKLENVFVEALKTDKEKTIGYYKERGKKIFYTPSEYTIFGCVIEIDTSVKKYKLSKLFCEFEKIDLVNKRKSKCKAGIVFYFFKVVNNHPVSEYLIDPIIVEYAELKENFIKEIPYSPIIDNETGAVFIGIELQSLECISKEGNFKSYYLPLKLDLVNSKTWSFYNRIGQWKNAKLAGLSGKVGISIQIKY